MPRYSVDDKVYNIPEEKEKDFLKSFPKAKLLSPLKQTEGNEDDTTDQTPNDVSQNTESDSENTSSDLQENSNVITEDGVTLEEVTIQRGALDFEQFYDEAIKKSGRVEKTTAEKLNNFHEGVPDVSFKKTGIGDGLFLGNKIVMESPYFRGGQVKIKLPKAGDSERKWRKAYEQYNRLINMHYQGLETRPTTAEERLRVRDENNLTSEKIKVQLANFDLKNALEVETDPNRRQELQSTIDYNEQNLDEVAQSGAYSDTGEKSLYDINKEYVDSFAAEDQEVEVAARRQFRDNYSEMIDDPNAMDEYVQNSLNEARNQRAQEDPRYQSAIEVMQTYQSAIEELETYREGSSDGQKFWSFLTGIGDSTQKGDAVEKADLSWVGQDKQRLLKGMSYQDIQALANGDLSEERQLQQINTVKYNMFNESMDAIEDRSAELESAANEIKSREQEIQNQADAIQKEADRISKEYESLSPELETYQSLIEGNVSDLDDIQKQIDKETNVDAKNALINQYNSLLSEYNNNYSVFQELRSSAEQLMSKRDAMQQNADNLNSEVKNLRSDIEELNAEGEMLNVEQNRTFTQFSFDIATKTFESDFAATDEYYKWKNEHLSDESGIFGSIRDLANNVTVGLTREAIDFFVGTNLYGLNVATSFLKNVGVDQISKSDSEYVYDRYDRLNVLFENWKDNPLPALRVADDLEGGSFTSYKHTLKTLGNMLPFTLGLIAAARKGDVNKMGYAYKSLAKKGIKKETLQSLKTAETAFRFTVMDNYSEGKKMGLSEDQANEYAMMQSMATAIASTVMPDYKLIGGVTQLKNITKTFVGNLKTAVDKKTAYSFGKQFLVDYMKELGEEELELVLSDLTKHTFNLSHATEFTNFETHQQILEGTLILNSALKGASEGLGTGDIKSFKKQIYNGFRQRGNDIILDFENQIIEVDKRIQEATIAGDQIKIDAFNKTRAEMISGRDYAMMINNAINLSPESVTDEQLDFVIQKQELLELKKNTDPAFHALYNDQIKKLEENIANSDVMSVTRKNLANTINNVELMGSKMGITVKVFEGENSTQDMYSWAAENTTVSEQDLESSIGNHGGATTDIDGNEVILINKDVALSSTGANVASHELLHKMMAMTLAEKDADGNALRDAEGNMIVNKEAAIAISKALGPEIMKIDPSAISDSIFQRRVQAYQSDPASVQAQELVTLFADAIATGDIKIENNAIDKAKAGIRRTLQEDNVLSRVSNGVTKMFGAIGFDNITFNTGTDLVNFLVDYNESIKRGNFTQAQENMFIEGAKIKGEISKLKTSESVVEAARKERLFESTEGLPSEFLQSREEASAKVQDIYNNQGEAGAFEIFEVFKPITRKLVRKYENVPGFDAEQLTSEIEIGKRGIYDLIRGYDPDSGVPLAAYINKFLPARSIEAANRVLKTEFEEDVTEARGVAADETSEDTIAKPERKTKLKVLADDLGISESVSNEVSNANIDKAALVSFKSVPNGATNSIGEAMGISPKKILNKANLTRGEVDSAQRFINKNADNIISALPEGFDSADKATGVPKTILKQFYNQRSARAKTKAGLKVQIKNPNLKTSEFLDYFGIVKGQPNKYDRNLSAKIIALANVLDRVATNQTLRQQNPELANIASGMSNVMFSRDENLEFSGVKASWAIMSKDLKYERLNLKKQEDREDFKDWIRTFGSKILGREFWLETGTILGSGAQNVRILDKDGNQLYFDKEGNVSAEKKKGSKELREYKLSNGKKIRNNDPLYEQSKKLQVPNEKRGKHAFASVAQAKDYFENTEFKQEGEAVKAATTRQAKYKAWDSNQSLEWLKNNQEALNSSEDGFVEIWLAIQEDIRQNPNNKKYWAAVLESTSISQEHFSRIGSRFAFTNTLGLKNVEEHTQPASDFAATLFAMADMGALDESTIRVAVANSYLQGALPEVYDNLLKGEGFSYVSRIPAEHQRDVFFGITPVWIRYINPEVNNMKHAIDGVEYKGINPNVILLSEGQTLAEEYGLGVNKSLYKEQDVISYQQELMFQFFAGNITQASAANKLQEYTSNYKASKDEDIANITSRVADKAAATNKNTPTVGMSTFDFDETLIIDGENFIVATNPETGEKVNISSGNWPLQGPKFAAQGYEFDFTDFVNVRGGVDGPLLQKMKNQIAKYGPKNVYVLTARPAESAVAIHEWLKTKDINIDLANITGLGNSTGDAKAEWMLRKYEEGYNDMYFVDDALPNVEAVAHVFNQLDVKGKSVQAKINFSKDIDSDFNNMLERTKGVGAQKIFSRVEGRKRGRDKGRFTLFVPPSAEDFTGLLRYFAGTGAQGDADIKFFEESLVKPFARAERKMQELRGLIRSEYKALNKKYPGTKKALGKKLGSTGFTLDQAIRIYLYDKAGHDIPGLAENKRKELIKIVKSIPSNLAYADEVGRISRRKEGYVKPDEFWDAGTIAADFDGLMKGVTRKEYLGEFIENADIIFSAKNLNKIEAVYGSQFRSALEDVLYRMKSGVNRSAGKSYGQNWTNWVNGSVGAIMFFNARSAVLQTLSTVNFINFEDNNIFAAGKAFANQKQYWSDFSMLFNSDFLKNRRAGLATNVNEAELANAVATASNKAKAALSYLLKIGFTPTQVADSFAIASGGATFYRNRVSKYLKEGFDKADAESQAMLDFQEIAEETQQSARPDRISQQQASPLGRLILAFANTPMQYNRLIKKAAGDLINRRGDWRSNMSRILYYGAVQNLIFASLQNALFAVAFEEEEEEEKQELKRFRVLNSMFDSLARGSGVYGAALATLKNAYFKYIEEDQKGFRADYGQVLVEGLNVSPPMGSKARKLYSAFNARKFNREVMNRMDNFDINNPVVPAIANVIEATTNLPLARLDKKINNIREAMNKDNSNMQRLFLALGWSSWDLNVGKKVVRNKGKSNEYTVFLDERRQSIEEVKTQIKQDKIEANKEKREQKKKDKELKQQRQQEAKIKENIEKQKQEGDKATCAAVSSSGKRCKRKPVSGGFCTVHEKVETNDSGEMKQCKKTKSDGKRCKMQTNSKSGFCYYHD